MLKEGPRRIVNGLDAAASVRLRVSKLADILIRVPRGSRDLGGGSIRVEFNTLATRADSARNPFHKSALGSCGGGLGLAKAIPL